MRVTLHAMGNQDLREDKECKGRAAAKGYTATSRKRWTTAGISMLLSPRETGDRKRIENKTNETRSRVERGRDGWRDVVPESSGRLGTNSSRSCGPLARKGNQQGETTRLNGADKKNLHAGNSLAKRTFSSGLCRREDSANATGMRPKTERSGLEMTNRKAAGTPEVSVSAHVSHPDQTPRETKQGKIKTRRG